ncbi:MAG: DUF4957 domain-containing protein [Bacteroidales bacterium]|nr:DUF4957 domain-containing protein [Bacteroidales bacterium]
MKRIFSAIISGTSLILFGAGLSSCTEEMVDINDEVALGRCLTPTELSAKVINGEFIEFSWTKSKGATEFVLELYSDEPMTELVESITIPAAEVPYTADLEADMTYYARVKGVNGDGAIADSHWATFDRALQTYAIKSSLNPELVDRTASSITIKWAKDPEVDHVRITPALNAEEEYTRFDVDAAAVEAAQVEVTGLNPSVKYTLAVHFKSADRGQITAWTQPDLEGVTRVESAEAFAAALADGQSRFVFPYNDGIRYELGELQINHSLELYGETSKDGKFPNVLVSIKFKNGGTADAKFHFEQLHLDGSAGQVYGERSNIIDISEAVATNKIESFTVLNCEVSNYTKNVYYDNKGVTLGSLVLRESIFTNIGSASQDFASFRADATACNSILIENNTIINNHRDILRIDKCAVPSIIFRNNTVVTNGKLTDGGLFIVQKDVTVFEMTSNLFLDVYKAEKGLILDAKCKAPTLVANNFFFNSDTEADPLGTSKELLLANGGAVLESSPCKDYIGGVCNVIDETVLAAKAGDPRWLVPYVEVPEDLTQTVTSTITTWDLNDATVFRGKADKDMVRGNIRFYVQNTPFNLGGGMIEFTGKSTVDDAGVPTDAGMGIKVNEPGSIVVSTAASELAGEHSHLTVSLNGEVSASVPVGAEYQKVTFPNITEESTIYITACDPIAITFLQWTSDVQVLDKVLATPVVSIDKTVVNERAEGEITLTWEPVDYAASYNVTIDGKKKNITETTYSFATAAFAVEEEGGDFAIQVTAVPADDDYTREESAPAELSFHVNDVPIVDTGEVVDPSAITETYFAELTEAGGFAAQKFEDGAGAVTIDKLTFGDKAELDGKRYKHGGATVLGEDGIPTNRYVSFKITRPGTISHKVISGSSSATDRAYAVALVTNVAGTKTVNVLYQEYSPTSSSAEPVTTEVTADMLAGITEAAVVYIYTLANCNTYAVGYDPVPAAPAKVDKVWDFSATEWVDAMTGSGIAANTNDSNWNLEVDGLKVVSGGGSIKWNFSGETYFWQPGGKSDGTTRYFEFTTDVAGKLTVYASNTGSSEDLDRKVTVKVGDGEPESLPGGYSSSDLGHAVDFNITAGTVKIYPTGNGLRFYKIEFHSN